ncbi:MULTISPECIES: hypothetical protein [Cupriavidus]|uniref:Uncharacterized protein n=1 Tax=Cupriavidus alkaliphilus TaxID=942866 RepID=A0A7W4YQ41_9BURK|nr:MULTISPECIES: hypothetical protein [Cupriavidus]MBB3006027.1 hypothetical protein [Cupriavidus alkaliphilus]SCB10230.1 hypothetical protein GA0116996_101639 [Cupriavidus alkaliphilus]SPA44851.1 conserved hypothetical protein [Cupriavidus taiwanensis]
MAGRKPFQPTDEDRRVVTSLAGFGAPHEYIASQVINPQTGKPLTAKTLRAHFRAELDNARDKTNALVAQALFKQATGTGKGAVPAAIFWMKVRAGWKEPAQGIELTGKDGGPVEQRTTVVDEKQVAAAVAKLEDEY